MSRDLAGESASRSRALRSELTALLPAEAVSFDAAQMAPHLRDNRGQLTGRALAMIRPASVDEVARLLRWCSERRVSVVPQGGNTGNSGGATPDASGAELLLCMERMHRVRSVDAANFSMTVEAGCTLAQVQAAADTTERYFPLHLGSAGSCQVGGILATNAGGIHVLRYGMARDLTLGLEVVLADGRVLSALRSLRKDNTGYDLQSLFVGSEGTLGVITAATLKLWPSVRSVALAWVALRDLDAVLELLSLLRASGGERLSAMELMPRAALQLLVRHIAGSRPPLGTEAEWQVLIEWTSPGDEDLDASLQTALLAARSAGFIGDAVLAQSDAQRQQFWALRERVSEAQGRAGPGLKHDIAVPLTALPVFLRQAANWVAQHVPEGVLIAYGHAGDGNLHFNVHRIDGGDAQAFRARGPVVANAIYDLVEQHGGSISAEHGIGRFKVGELARRASRERMAAMRAIKQALDPLGILNPGVLLTAPAS